MVADAIACVGVDNVLRSERAHTVMQEGARGLDCTHSPMDL